MEYFISTAIFSAMVSKLGQVIYKDKIEFVHEDSKKKVKLYINNAYKKQTKPVLGILTVMYI